MTKSQNPKGIVHELKVLLGAYNIRPKKRLGQNFLISKKVLEKIIEMAELQPDDIVLEIGPGTGIITRELAKRVKKVIAVEKDQKMVELLREMLEDWKVGNVEIVKEDILKLNFQFSIFNFQSNSNFQFSNRGYKVVANLPYYITAPVIRKFLEAANRPQLMLLVVQKEVGERICAKPPHMSKLAVFSQVQATSQIVSFVSRKSFWPQPKVDSLILKIIPYTLKPFNAPKFPPRDHRDKQNRETDIFYRFSLFTDFPKIVKAGFSQPRKQLIKNLSRELNLSRQVAENWLLQNHIDPSQRAETLNTEDWLKLTRTYQTLNHKASSS